MGKQARLRGLRRWLRGQGDVAAEVADSVDRRVRGRSSHGDMRYGRGSAMAASEQDPRAYPDHQGEASMTQFSDAATIMKQLYPRGDEGALFLFASAMRWLAAGIDRSAAWDRGECACGEPLPPGAVRFDRCHHR